MPSSWFSILINGSYKGFFPAQGIEIRGDPISPFQFVIVVKPFSLMFAASGAVNLIQGFKLAPKAPMISRL